MILFACGLCSLCVTNVLTKWRSNNRYIFFLILVELAKMRDDNNRLRSRLSKYEPPSPWLHTFLFELRKIRKTKTTCDIWNYLVVLWKGCLDCSGWTVIIGWFPTSFIHIVCYNIVVSCWVSGAIVCCKLIFNIFPLHYCRSFVFVAL